MSDLIANAIMTNNKNKKKSSNSGSNGKYIGMGIAVIVAIGAVAWLINSQPSQEEWNAKVKSQYTASLVQMIRKKNSLLSESQLQTVANCAYDEDPDVLWIRQQRLAEEEQRNEGRVIVSSDPKLRKPFLDSLEGYVNGDENSYMLSEEINRINDAIDICLSTVENK